MNKHHGGYNFQGMWRIKKKLLLVNIYSIFMLHLEAKDIGELCIELLDT